MPGVGPSLSYAGVRDGPAHVLAPLELWRQGSGSVTDVDRRGGRRMRALRWSRRPERGDLLLLGLYADEVARHGLGGHQVAPLRVHHLIELDTSPETYLARFGRKGRENIRRGLRRHWPAGTASDVSPCR
ncbi:hypothetical protein ACIBQ6_13275 [Nonomuraea sp. NPDC049655]|uniref:hypothetical protein n=1 Tax=Nonomuraea sp. NPDC049655 TaxID=3364355 RepID=UPI0037BC1C7F